MANKKPLNTWKPGQSGNPKGAPPSGHAMKTLIEEFLNGDTKVVIKNKDGSIKEVRSMNARKAFIQKVLGQAMDGNSPQQALIMKYTEKLPTQDLTLGGGM